MGWQLKMNPIDVDELLNIDIFNYETDSTLKLNEKTE